MDDIKLARQLGTASNCDTHPNEWPQLRPLLRRIADRLERAEAVCEAVDKYYAVLSAPTPERIWYPLTAWRGGRER